MMANLKVQTVLKLKKICNRLFVVLISMIIFVNSCPRHCAFPFINDQLATGYCAMCRVVKILNAVKLLVSTVDEI